MFKQTNAFNKIAHLTKRIRIAQGGTSASKTISILLYLIAKAQSDKTPTVTSIVSESFPHLRRGAIRDFTNIMTAHGYMKSELWNKTDSIYTFETGSKIEFFSADQPDKLRGSRRDRLFINECNNVEFDAFEQLEVRTKEFIFLDFNPSNEFWVFTEVIPKRTDVDYIILTYKDNGALSPEIVASIEQRKERKSWWRVYGEGQLGEVAGRIYTGWNIVEEIPFEAKLLGFGLDFGYSVDPTSIVALYEYNGGYILDEITYVKGLLNSQIAATIHNQETNVITIADSAEPKSIDEIRLLGVNILPCQKGPDSIRTGIQNVQDKKVSITKRSVNGIKEYRNYLWKTDSNERVVNIPDPLCANHFLDAARYIITFFNQRSQTPIARQYIPTHLRN